MFFIFNLNVRTNPENQSENPLHQSGHWSFSELLINGSATGVGAQNWTWAVNQEWCSGSGTWNDPYVIENVSIDGGGSGNCMSIYNSRAYFRIENCTILNSGSIFGDSGIFLKNVTNGLLFDNNIGPNNEDGISIDFCDNMTIIENHITDNDNRGITLRYSNNNTISKNNISDGGIYLYNCDENNFSNNILSSGGISINFYSNKNLIIGNKINLSSTGILLFTNCSYNTIFQNEIKFGSQYGIQLQSACDNNNISENKIFNITGANGDGIYLVQGCNRNMISNNNLYNNSGSGIYTYADGYINSNNSINSNNISNNDDFGILLYKCEYTAIYSNIIFNNKRPGGGSGGAGISIQGNSHNSTISHNLINNNTGYGIAVIGIGGSDNLVYNNSFIGNGDLNGLDTMGSNDWDNGSLGNYWDDYTGNDTNDDGIGDSSYEVWSMFGGCYDNFPIWNDGFNGTAIHIDDDGWNNWEWARGRFWCSGSGSEADPYVIEDLIVNGSNSGSCISIENSDVYFRIENCTVFNAGSGDNDAGISLNNVTNGELTSNNCSLNNKNGIFLNDSISNALLNNSISNNSQGISLNDGNLNFIFINNISSNVNNGIKISSTSMNAFILYNFFDGNGNNAYDNGTNTIWDDGYAGNYWTNYSGADTTPLDGIGDTPHPIPGSANDNDTKPLMYLMNDDTDNDGLNNFEEYTLGNDGFRTNVTAPDSDYDNITDYWEWLNGTDPWNPDTDNDTVSDYNEIFGILGYITNATNPDTDSDGLLDGFEYGNNTNPLDPDTDDDLILDFDEINGTLGYVTNATNPDTDTDGLRDDYEYGNNTNPLDSDTDNDLLSDLNEINGTLGYVTNATNPDTDTDGLRDDYEYGNSTNPLDSDTDDDLLLDFDEINGTLGYITNATDSDTDNDGLRDDFEYGNSTNPLDPDTDGDTIINSTFNDYYEVSVGTNPNDIFWYPMPNLNVSSIEVSTAYEDQPFILNFTIINNGIWRAQGIIVIIQINELNLILYNNTATPFDLEVDESKSISQNCSAIDTPGTYSINLTLDPNNLINETYSNKDGSYRLLSNNDNNKSIQLQIIAEEQDPGPGPGPGAPTDNPIFIIILTLIIGSVGITIAVWKIKSKRGGKPDFIFPHGDDIQFET